MTDFRQIPSVSDLLLTPAVEELLRTHPRKLVVDTIRQVLDDLRASLRAAPNSSPDLSPSAIGLLVQNAIAESVRPSLCEAVNATGVILHTSLGRAPLAQEALRAVHDAAAAYCPLEVDVQSGKRGSRTTHVERLLCSLTGAEAALVVNNNAAAVLLVLQALAQGKEVIVSRSQLVEIGGSFRMPDVMAQSGAKLVEVGTTNKTYLSDYRNAITDNTALLLKVHASNFRITGFTAEVSIEELMSLGRERGIPVAYDIGSGALRDLSAFGLASEPLVMHSVAAGADLTTFSGDKLLGGPQAGIILGKEKLVGRLKKHPLTRALRVGKLTLAALEATLRLYWDDEGVTQRLPVLRMIALPLVEVALRAELLARQIQAVVGPRFTLAVQDDVSTVGGGSLPGEVLPTKVVSVSANGLSPDDLATRLRTNHPPIFGRIADDKLLLDPRTIAESQSEAIVAAFQRMAPQSP